MAYMRMSSGNAIFITLFFILYVTGVTGTIKDYAEHAAYGLADVARMRRFDPEICSGSPKWYREGMQIFAYKLGPFYWKKRHLTWALAKDPEKISKDLIISAMEAACAEWSRVSSLTFQRAPRGQWIDILVQAVPEGNSHPMISVYDGPDEIDRLGVTLEFYDMDWSKYQNWTDYLRYLVLYHMGAMLGIDNSEVPGAVMNLSSTSANGYGLTKDDIAAIQAKYGPPPSSRSTTRTTTYGPSPTTRWTPRTVSNPRTVSSRKSSSSDSSEASSSSGTSNSSETSSSSSSPDSPKAPRPPNSSRPPISSGRTDSSRSGGNPHRPFTREWRRWGDGYLRNLM